MRGIFDVTLLDAAGKDDAFFERARKEQRLDLVLKDLKPEHHCQGVYNRIFDNMAGYLLDKLFSLGNCASPYYTTNGGPQAALSAICLLNTDSETSTYTEDWSGYQYNGNNVLDSVGASAAKLFEEDQISPWELWSATDDRNAIYFRNRWLYTPSQAVSSDIKSVGIYFRSDGDNLTYTYQRYTGRIGRVRLKDDNGLPITLNKTAAQVLLIEYTFILASL